MFTSRKSQTEYAPTIGEWLATNGNRGEIVIGTKGSTLDLATLQLPTFSPEQVGREIEQSLSRLQTDCVDIYWLHRDNPSMAVADIHSTSGVSTSAPTGNIGMLNRRKP